MVSGDQQGELTPATSPKSQTLPGEVESHYFSYFTPQKEQGRFL